MATSYGFSPKQLSPALWLADRGNDPAIWEDLSGNGRHATQATAASQPAIVTNGLNGRQVRRFDGVNDMLTGSVWSNGQTTSFFIVFKKNTFGTNTAVFQYGTSNGHGLYVNASDQQDWVARSVALRTNGNVGLSAKIVSLIRSESVAYMYSNGLQNTIINSTSSQLNATGTFYIGNWEQASQYISGDIAEIIAFDLALSTSNRQLIEKYLSIKYNIPLA
jgi:hypothetical protein